MTRIAALALFVFAAGAALAHHEGPDPACPAGSATADTGEGGCDATGGE